MQEMGRLVDARKLAEVARLSESTQQAAEMARQAAEELERMTNAGMQSMDEMSRQAEEQVPFLPIAEFILDVARTLSANSSALGSWSCLYSAEGPCNMS